MPPALQPTLIRGPRTFSPSLTQASHHTTRTLRTLFSLGLFARGRSSGLRTSLSSLAGTVAPHHAYLLLHTHEPPSAYPPRSKSPLWRALTLRARRWGGIVNFACAPNHALHPAYTRFGEDDPASPPEHEAYAASLFASSHRGRLQIPGITLNNLDAVDAEIHAHCQRPQAVPHSGPLPLTDPVGAEPIFLYVCTHGSRDCRCGDTGGEVVRALRAEVASRGIARTVSVGEVAHVGGHKYAANVLVYPYGDWLGMVQPVDVPRIVDELLVWHASHRQANTMTDGVPPLCPPFWRGRMGLDKEEQLALASKKLAC